ncbi:hypothetical protein WA026_013476 [Henosepilachna vigintioctopunctata]|uniref:UDP-glucuronosyltransferase n=1 Tax=Henosepilachna vigintioctopunctata TaxID=420089 RepID=A0AAW1VD53_9CUCU
MKEVPVIVSVLLSLSVVQGANILGIWFHGGRSHHILGEILFKELARRGHNVTMASPFPLKEAFPNYTDIYLSGILEDQESRSKIFMEMKEGGFSKTLEVMPALIKSQTEITLANKEMKRLINSGTKFDVIIMDWFLNLAILYFGKLWRAPIIPVASFGTVDIGTVFTGNPEEPSYIPRFGVDLPQNMSFQQRVFNAFLFLVSKVIIGNYIAYHQNLIKKHFNDTMTEEEMSDTIALILSNAHYSFESPRPYVPNIIPIGGFHIPTSENMPKKFQDFLDSADNGAIFFSLGSNVKSTTLPAKTLQDILKVFSNLPYKIIFKWEDEDIKDRPKNVLISKWCPQNAILAHNNVKLFISHGGLLSTIEAIYHAVPVLGIPIFGDQKINIPSAVKKGYAVQLNLEELNEKTFSNAINELIDNPRYKDKVEKLSFLLKDQPLPPMDTAVFWVEHVIRHKGGFHLKNYGIRLPWYQYYMVDVIFFLTSIIFSILAFTYIIIRKMITIFRNKSDINGQNGKVKIN